MAERSLRMREVRGSIPCDSIFFFSPNTAPIRYPLSMSRGRAHTAGRGEMGDDEGRPTLHAWLSSLAEAHDVRVHPSLEFRETERSGRGLFASRDVPIGEVLLSVPRALALSVQDGAGVSLPPDGAWPRVRAGVAAASPDAGKSWECVLARAVAVGHGRHGEVAPALAPSACWRA